MTHNLTLNLGVRWEAHTPRVDAMNRQNSFDRLAINPVSGTPGVVTFAGLNGLGQCIYDGDYDNFAPRVGFAWKPFRDDKTVIHSGYGMFFGPPLPGSNNNAAGFSINGSYSTPDNGITPPFVLKDGFPAINREPLGPAFGAVKVGSPVRFAPTFIDQQRQLGYSQQWNFGIQRSVGFDTVIEAVYLGNVGHKLPAPDTSINQVPDDMIGPGNAQVRRPFPQFDAVTVVAPMLGNSSYHALNVKAEKRFSHGLNFLANYTYSKFIDDVFASFEIGKDNFNVQDLYNRRAEKALSGNDVRNRFVLSTVYELPLHGRITGGWSLGYIAILQQGAPVGLVMQTSNLNNFAPGPQRVNVLRDPSLPVDQRSTARWFDTTAVAAPAQYTYGNASRALLTGPGLMTMNLSLLKNFKVTERLTAQFRAESFNFINHANYGAPGNALGSSNFGVISTALDPRSNQLGLRLEF